ncbi:MAG TPA: magnesium chelatase subunit D family protein [Methanomicrobiales archaeon]|nr:magnesium chelatase subunit D family protein [Methanomicrobiales archaeon]
MTLFRRVYPFSAIVGQERMKEALVLNAVNPRIGGVLICGEKGTSKSTAARALAALLPTQRVVEGCPFGCDPDNPVEQCARCREKGGALPAAVVPIRIVELPVSATEDKVVGSLDIGHALKSGERSFEPGILARANRNLLYVDEVNLLNDHIVDVLLDVAAMGVNIVEREGVSFSHPASFILVGTMNPEEGELRPQLLDRFGLSVRIEGIQEPALRREVVERRILYERDPDGFCSRWEDEDRALAGRIRKAREILPLVACEGGMVDLAVQICLAAGVDGHRADITILKTAATLAALDGRVEVIPEDIREAALLALPHRVRRTPLTGKPPSDRDLGEIVRNPTPREEPGDAREARDRPSGSIPDASGRIHSPPGDPFGIRHGTLDPSRERDERTRDRGGRRSVTLAHDGRYVASRIPDEEVRDLAIDATLRAAAPRQKERGGGTGGRIRIAPEDLREKVRERKTGTTILFLVDASGSMGVQGRMSAVKGAVLSLLAEAYQRRDRVGMVAFQGDGARLVLPPTGSVELARERLEEIPTGGRTPLAGGLAMAREVLAREARARRDTLPLLVLLSDGRANVAISGGLPLDEALSAASRIRTEGIPSIVVDTDSGLVRLGHGQALAGALGGRHLRLEEIRADSLLSALRGTGM